MQNTNYTTKPRLGYHLPVTGLQSFEGRRRPTTGRISNYTAFCVALHFLHFPHFSVASAHASTFRQSSSYRTTEPAGAVLLERLPFRESGVRGAGRGENRSTFCSCHLCRLSDLCLAFALLVSLVMKSWSVMVQHLASLTACADRNICLHVPAPHSGPREQLVPDASPEGG